MEPRELVLDGTVLHAYFQPYHLNLSNGGRRPTPVADCEFSGELLSRPLGVSVSVEDYFSGLSVAQHFDVLGWQLALAEELCRDAGTHCAINLHNSVIHDEGDRNRLLTLMRGFSTPVTFEFTETFPMPPVSVANRFLRDVRRLGYTTALDDFGTGLNGMSLLTDFDFDIIKIDRVLSHDLGERLEKKKMLGLILKMLEVLGRDHVVEGIEDVDVYEFLVGIGYTQFQGFLFDRALPVDDFLTRHHLTKGIH